MSRAGRLNNGYYLRLVLFWLLTYRRQCGGGLQVRTFVSDVTAVLSDEESEAAKRYSRSAMGKSFSRKRSTKAV